MWTPSSTPSKRRSRPSSVTFAIIALAAFTGSCGDSKPAAAQQIVFDPTNHIENALQAARALESLANEVNMLANEARMLAASPYSHLAQTSQTLKDISDLASAVKGVASEVNQIQTQFANLYPTAVDGLDPRKALQQHNARTEVARQTAQDLARTAAELERLAKSRQGRVSGALSASETAKGQTSAIQSTNQLLVVLSEDLGSMRSILVAQSRLMAEETARRSAERAATADARKQFWGEKGTTPANPNFDPLSHARN